MPFDFPLFIIKFSVSITGLSSFCSCFARFVLVKAHKRNPYPVQLTLRDT